jgi:putative oxidoreductase
MKRLYPQFLAGWRGVGLLFIRLVVGTALVLHGWQKIENPFHWMDRAPNAAPAFLQGMAVLAEVGGGALLIVGLLTPLAAFLVACDMIGALSLVHLPHGDPFVAAGAGASSYERALVYLAVSVGLMVLGPGRFAFDAMLFKRKDRVAEEKREWLKIPAA